MEVPRTSFPPSEGRTYDYAEAYHDAGWSVIPLRPLDKRPLVAWEPFQKRRASLPEIIGWLQRWPTMNLGIVTGAVSGIAAIDLDGSAGIAALKAANVSVPPTLTQKTPHGWHAVYRLAGASVKTGAGLFPHVDTRGEGGYVAVAPSKLADGKYEWLAPIDMAPVPEWLPTAAARTQTPFARPGSAEQDGWVRRALDGGVGEGERNAMATRLAGYLRAHRIPIDIAVVLLRPFATACTPPMDDEELEDVLRSVARYPEGAAGIPTENFMVVGPS